MSVDSRIFTRILVENQILRNRTSRRIASRNLTSELVPYLESEMLCLSKELTVEQTRVNSPGRRRKNLEPIRPNKEVARSTPHMEKLEVTLEVKHKAYPPHNLEPLKLRSILEKCSRFHRPANCSLSNSEQFMDRQLQLVKNKAEQFKDWNVDDIAESDISGYEQVRQARQERQQRQRFQVLNRVCHENRKKLQRALNKREKARAKFYTIT